MSVQNRAKQSDIIKKAKTKSIGIDIKKEDPVHIKEAFKGWKESQQVTLSLAEVDKILDDAFNAVDNLWTDYLTRIIAELDSISKELSKAVNEHKRGDIQIEYSEFDKFKNTLITTLNPGSNREK